MPTGYKPLCIIDAASILIILLAWYIFYIPPGYWPVDGEQYQEVNKQKLKKLVSVTFIVGFAQVLILIFMYHTSDVVEFEMIGQLLYYGCLCGSCGRLNSTANAYSGGHISIFISIVFNLAKLIGKAYLELLNNYSSARFSIPIIQVILSVLLMIYYGTFCSNDMRDQSKVLGFN